MSHENVKTIRALYDAVNGGDLDAIAAFYAEHVVVDLSESVGPDAGVYEGKEAAVAMWSHHMEHWDWWSWELENITEVTPDRIVAANRVRGRGAGSGIEVDARIGQVWDLAEGKVVWVKMFQSEAEALAAASEETMP